MRRLTLALGCAALLAGSALAQAPKSAPTPKPLTDYKAVQEHLYGLNYKVGERTGQLTPELKGAIAQWRKNRNSAAAGDMTDVEAAQLLAIPLSKVWGAMSYSSTGAHGTVWNKTTRDLAEKEVQAACDKDSKKCTIVTIAGTSCAAIATFTGSADGRTSASTWGSFRPTAAAASAAALADCKKTAPQPDACTARDIVCADGSHKK
jgi:Domain of unknown function (DUF4189)